MIGTAIVAIAMASCSNSNSIKKDVDELSRYVDSVDHVEPVYTDAQWKEIDNGYQDRNIKVEKNMSLLQSDEKESVEASHVKYDALKNKYETKMKEPKTPDAKLVLRNNLFGEGKLGADLSFSWVNAGNIENVYENFVNAVESHKNDYSSDDWNDIKLMYVALDNRKEELDKDISGKDKLKIAGLKVKYTAIKAVHKPIAKAEEKMEEKK